MVFCERSKSVKEGKSVTLKTYVKTKQQEMIEWYFNGICIAKIIGDQRWIYTDDEETEEFRDRLKLDHKTGSLTITNIRITDEGEYKLLMINNSEGRKETIFNVTISTALDSGLLAAVERFSAAAEDFLEKNKEGIGVIGVIGVIVSATAGGVWSRPKKT